LLPPVHTYRGIHSEERKGRKSLFLFTAQLLRNTNLDPIFSESRSGMITHKNKKRITAGTQFPTCREESYDSFDRVNNMILYTIWRVSTYGTMEKTGSWDCFQTA
jgi:hypothetical protein